MIIVYPCTCELVELVHLCTCAFVCIGVLVYLQSFWCTCVPPHSCAQVTGKDLEPPAESPDDDDDEAEDFEVEI